MKLAFAKEPYCVEYTWSSMKWKGAQELLDNWVFRSQNISLAIGHEADMWVLGSRTRVDGGWLQTLEGLVPEDVDALYDAHETVPVDSIPWGEYDVVITTDPIIPKHIIMECPDTLFCYYECGHTTESAWRSRHQPQGGYDLYLDHFMHTDNRDTRLMPVSISFPYTVSPTVLQQLVNPPRQRRGILIDGKTSAPPDIFEDVVMGPHIKRFHKAIAEHTIISPREWLERVASCRYGLLFRGDNVIGQAAIEEAALGLIVLGQGIYPKMFCHPESLPRQISWPAIRRHIDSLDRDLGFRNRILDWQRVQLEWAFWDKPIGILRRGLVLKRS